MRIIRSVEIERFRSFDNARLTEFSDFTALVGPNNSGKSNVIRALNLFFNEETDLYQDLDFDVDYHLGAPAKKKKQIRVAVEFEVPDILRYRKGLEDLGNYLGKRFWIRKTYGLEAPYEPELEVARGAGKLERVTGEEADKARAFLRLVSFRYVPNRAIPAEVIREESRAVVEELARRVRGYGRSDVETVIADLKGTAHRMVAAMAEDMKRWCPGISELELATPTGLHDMLSSAAFRAALGEAGMVSDTSLGAGAQSLLMFHVLHLIDRSASQRGFGWRQATVWGVEEPESSLHRELQVRLAALLRAYAEPGGRFQILVTTHNEIFVYSAKGGFAVTLVDSKSRAEPRDVAALADEAAARQVTGPCPPALKFPLETVVLVEGPTDCRILERAAQLTGVATDLEFRSVPELDPSFGSGGREQIRKFLASHAPFLQSRLPQHPLLVLLDWDTRAGQLKEFQKRYGANGPKYVFRMDEREAEPALDKSFKGIERFFSKRLIERAAQNGILPGIGEKFDGTLMASPGELGSAKPRLAEFFCQEAERGDCRFLRHALEWAEEAPLRVVS